jgi:heme exporter protein B
MPNFLMQQIKREYSLFRSGPHALYQALMFFIMLMVFFPMALPYSPSLYREVLPGILWVSLSFAIFLNTAQFFSVDLECGYLSQLVILQKPIMNYVYAKVLINGGAILASILLISPIVAVLYHLSIMDYIALNLCILTILPGILILCTLMASFSAFRQRHGLLLLIILFPLMLPFLIIGSMGFSAALSTSAYLPYLAIGLALSLIAFTILPFIISSILKNGIQIA